MATPSVTQVFDTTELVEMILLDNDISMPQLFLLQRVNKRFKGVIDGSRKLRRRMFLDYGTQTKQLESLLNLDSAQTMSLIYEQEQHIVKQAILLFNPLVGIRPSTLDACTAKLTIFQHSCFWMWHGNDNGCPRFKLVSDHPTGSMEKDTKSCGRSSWRNLKISSVPLELSFKQTEKELPSGVRKLFNIDKNTSMGELADSLDSWYLDLSNRGAYEGLIMRLVADVRIDWA